MTAGRKIGLAFLIVWGAAGIWIMAFNAGTKAHPARDLPSPCVYPLPPTGAVSTGAAMTYASMQWTCNNGVWTTNGIQNG